MSQFVIYARATTYNPYRTYPRNADRYVRAYEVNHFEDIESRKALIESKGERITGIYTRTGKRIG